MMSISLTNEQIEELNNRLHTNFNPHGMDLHTEFNKDYSCDACARAARRDATRFLTDICDVVNGTSDYFSFYETLYKDIPGNYCLIVYIKTFLAQCYDSPYSSDTQEALTL
jgi:hypothetical protein